MRLGLVRSKEIGASSESVPRPGHSLQMLATCYVMKDADVDFTFIFLEYLLLLLHPRWQPCVGGGTNTCISVVIGQFAWFFVY